MCVLPVSCSNSEVVERIHENVNICVRFTEKVFECFRQTFHDVPAVWPAIPGHFQHTEEGMQCVPREAAQQAIDADKDCGVNEVGFWGLPQHHELLQSVLQGTIIEWYFNDAILIPSRCAWNCSDISEELGVIWDKDKEENWPDRTLEAFVRLTRACGWSGMICSHESHTWWLMFDKKTHELAQTFWASAESSKEQGLAKIIAVKNGRIQVNLNG